MANIACHFRRTIIECSRDGQRHEVSRQPGDAKRRLPKALSKFALGFRPTLKRLRLFGERSQPYRLSPNRAAKKRPAFAGRPSKSIFQLSATSPI
jgi:hypothetical protein